MDNDTRDPKSIPCAGSSRGTSSAFIRSGRGGYFIRRGPDGKEEIVDYLEELIPPPPAPAKPTKPELPSKPEPGVGDTGIVSAAELVNGAGVVKPEEKKPE